SSISRELGFLLEAHDLIGSRYRLNVSSPGLSRPLTDRRQYGKNSGRTVRVRFKNGDQYERAEGVLVQVQDDGIEVEVGNDRKKIAFDAILETKVIPQL
ncbi:MAG: ribosome maturation factor, partial [Balneolaceae bacterium]